MSEDTPNQRYRGVLCQHCGKPVRVPGFVVRKENVFRSSEPDLAQHLISRVFTLRCHSCEREAIYGIHQIVDCAAALQPALLRKMNAALSQPQRNIL
jgi:hypothetical protein